MSRKLLVISSHPLDPGVLEEFEASNWILHVAQDPSSARRELEQHDFLVGLFVLWPDDSKRHQANLVDMVTNTEGIRWIGGLDRDILSQDHCLSLVAEHLDDFVSLPLDPLRLTVVIGHAYGMAELDRQFMAKQRGPLGGEFGLLGSSRPMGVLFDEIRQAAATDAPVCISGETGSGKEATARAIHAASNRAQGPFIAINCAALLFGHPRPELAREKPISTESIGLEEAFAATNAGGSLFLDGLEDLNDAAQTRLLSLIDAETRSRTRGGAPAPWEGARLRIISSSAGELETRVQKGEFRSDLFYRLKVLPIQVPSLRERGEDIWILARYFLAQLREQYSIKAAGFSKDALAVLALHDWPGNLHELRSRVHGAALSCKGPYITPTDLDLEKRGPWRHRMTLQQVREEAEHRAIEAAVKRNSMNLTRAAEELGVSRMTLYRMLEKHEIEVER